MSALFSPFSPPPPLSLVYPPPDGAGLSQCYLTHRFCFSSQESGKKKKMVCKAKKRTDCRQLHFVQTEEKASRVQARKRGKGRARAALHLKKEKILQKRKKKRRLLQERGRDSWPMCGSLLAPVARLGRHGRTCTSAGRGVVFKDWGRGLGGACGLINLRLHAQRTHTRKRQSHQRPLYTKSLIPPSPSF